MSIRVFYFRQWNIPMSVLPEAYLTFLNKQNKSTKIPTTFSRECPFLFFVFVFKQQAWSRASVCSAAGESQYGGWLSLAPEDTSFKVTEMALEEPHLTVLVEPELWVIHLAEGWSKKRQKSERCWRERQMSHGQGKITCSRGPTSGNTEMGKMGFGEN